jgi:hypothetical protein
MADESQEGSASNILSDRVGRGNQDDISREVIAVNTYDWKKSVKTPLFFALPVIAIVGVFISYRFAGGWADSLFALTFLVEIVALAWMFRTVSKQQDELIAGADSDVTLIAIQAHE